MRLPTTKSLNGKLLYLLLQNQSLKHLDFQAMTGSYRMAAYVYELERRYRWQINRKNESRFCTYWLSKEQKLAALEHFGLAIKYWMLKVSKEL